MVAKFGENSQKNYFSSVQETKIEFEDDSKGMFDSLIQKFGDLFNPKVEKMGEENSIRFNELKTVLEKVAGAFSSQEKAFKDLQSKHNELETKFSDLLKKHEDLDKKFEQTPNPNFKQRPVHTGNPENQSQVVY